MFFLEQAFTLNQSDTGASDSKQKKSNQEVILLYYTEMAAMHVADGKDNQAIDCHLKAIQIAKSIYGEDSFNTLECCLNLAKIYEKKGMTAEADAMLNQCLQNFDK